MKLFLFTCLLLFSPFVVLSSAKTGRFCTKEENVNEQNSDNALGSPSTRRFLQGSTPPDCKDKCGSCTPCVAVLARGSPSPPQASAHRLINIGIQDYYPLKWWCQCKGKLYKP
ncbi:Polygalacturonase [Handroanthus impetiginosus]|uniref:Epidermal patterning factor-like protein n=1 Tax=Handroanthus impetiginosus TaxID=429701 RepID=A0A2G9G232_9LAMI|nr:Polygalacturonase [Handroanthus impetiginosus]